MNSCTKDEVVSEEVAPKEEAVGEEEDVEEGEEDDEEGEEVAPKEEVVEEGDEEEVEHLRFQFIRPRHKWSLIVPESKLILVVRTAKDDEPDPASEELLGSIRLWIPHTGVFIKADKTIMHILQKLRPYVNYGHLSVEAIKSLIEKTAGMLVEDDTMVEPFGCNPGLVEQAFGQYNIVTIEDVVNEIANVGPHFEDVSKAIFPIPLDVPEPRKGKKKDKKKRQGLLRKVLTKSMAEMQKP